MGPQGFADTPVPLEDSYWYQIECHHIFCQELEPWFKERGIENIHKFLVRLPRGVHRGKFWDGVHTKFENWNAEWKGWKDENPKADPEEIIDKAKEMLKKYRINGFPGGNSLPSIIIVLDPCKFGGPIMRSICNGTIDVSGEPPKA